MATALLNRLAGIGIGLAVTGAVVNSTLYNGMIIRLDFQEYCI